MSSILQKPNIAIVILAAGASSRMGTPKQLLPWGTTTLLGHSIDQATSTTIEDIYLILGSNQEKITAELKTISVTTLVNKDWQAGLGSSISYAVCSIGKLNKDYDGLLIILADQPQVDTHYLNLLIGKFQSGKRQIITTSYDNQVGVPAIFDKVYFEKLSSLKGDKGAKSIIEEHVMHLTTCSPKINFTDIDTKATYDQLYHAFFSDQ